MALRNKAFGSAQEFVWALESSEYAIRETSGAVKLFRNFKERKSFTPDYGAEGMSLARNSDTSKKLPLDPQINAKTCISSLLSRLL